LLRISFETNPQTVTLKLEGKLSGPWVDEVARTWFDVNGEKPDKEVTVDLSGVTYVDGDGKRLLGWMFQRGARLRLRNGHLMTQYIVDQVMRETAQPQPPGGR
jgi:ABC-type transporter Mla MlaB component